MDSSQMVKGVLSTAALAVISRGDAYGWQVLHDLRDAGLSNVGDASVYGTLQRLYQDGMLSAYVVPSASGPSRKYYSLTAEGRSALKTGREEWREFHTVISRLLDDEMVSTP
jgi:PadR family transcriptional regulator PadR